MLYALQAGITGPTYRTYAWCYSATDKCHEYRDLPDGGMEVIEYPAPIRAHFGGGRSWPDVANNGGSFPLLLFSQAAVDILLHYDPKGTTSEPGARYFWANKSLSRTGPPVYRTFIPSAALRRQELGSDADSPAIFNIVDRPLSGLQSTCEDALAGGEAQEL